MLTVPSSRDGDEDQRVVDPAVAACRRAPYFGGSSARAPTPGMPTASTSPPSADALQEPRAGSRWRARVAAIVSRSVAYDGRVHAIAPFWPAACLIAARMRV